jgi:DNA repair protein RecO (recombination protein O)
VSQTHVYQQPAFILQRKNYRETSVILEALTRDQGIVPLVARGVRQKNSRLAQTLHPFVQLELSWRGKSSLKQLVQAETVAHMPLAGMALYSGFYLNELVQCFLHQHDPHPDVYQLYWNSLTAMQSTEDVAEILRYFELNLLNYCGYGIVLDQDKNGIAIQPDICYRFIAGVGLVQDAKSDLSGQTLLALHQGQRLSRQHLKQAKQLMRGIIDQLLGNKPLKSREVLAAILRYR